MSLYNNEANAMNMIQDAAYLAECVAADQQRERDAYKKRLRILEQCVKQKCAERRANTTPKPREVQS